MRKRDYKPIAEAPKDGRPILAFCGGIECVVCWHDPAPGILPEGWYYWDDDDFCPTQTRPTEQPNSEWREMY